MAVRLGHTSIAARFSLPGTMLRLLTQVPLPVLGAERFARRMPQPGRLGIPSEDPLVEPIEPRACKPGILDGDVVIKDQIDVAGCPTGIGRATPGAIATRDATIVTRIADAGGRIIGKAKMTELGIDGLGLLMHYPMPANPRAPGYLPGGSSTGTAVAVASGIARYGVGGDGLGSIRIPAAFCGLIGLKPSRDRVPRDGIYSPVRTLDAAGPIARTAEDCARIWYVMAGEPVEALTPWFPDRIAVPRGIRAALSITRAFQHTLARIPAKQTGVDLGLDSITAFAGLIAAYELATGPYASDTRTPAGRLAVQTGRRISPQDAARLYARRDALRGVVAAILSDAPIIALPTTAIPPPAIGSPDGNIMLHRALGAFTPLANLTDLPAIAVPCGSDERGRPLSIMFIAAYGQETALLRLALAIEQNTSSSSRS